MTVPPHATISAHVHRRVWERAGGRCTHCGAAIPRGQPYTDLATLDLAGRYRYTVDQLRLLCRRCQVLRGNKPGMVATALRDGIIPPNWRELVWDD
jgi:5-methylcytosine-specific restriction enzyme A